MIILVYIGILFFCYGVYNLICYMAMLPSVRAGWQMKKICSSYSSGVFDNTMIMALAEKVVNKRKIKLNHIEFVDMAVFYSGRKYDGNVFLISRVLSCFAMLLICLPIVFYNMRLMLILDCACILLTAADVSFLMMQYKLYEKSLKKDLVDILYLAKRHFKETEDVQSFYEVCANKTKGVWRQIFVRLTGGTEIQNISRVWTDRWLKLFADGLQNENKGGYFEQLYYDIYSERFSKLKEKLKYTTKLAELLPGVLIFCLTILHTMLVYIILSQN